MTTQVIAEQRANDRAVILERKGGLDDVFAPFVLKVVTYQRFKTLDTAQQAFTTAVAPTEPAGVEVTRRRKQARRGAKNAK